MKKIVSTYLQEQINQWAWRLFRFLRYYRREQDAIEVLVRRGSPIIPRIMDAMEEHGTSWDDRVLYLEVLVQIGDPTVIPFFIDLSEDTTLRPTIAEMLESFPVAAAQEHAKTIRDWIEREAQRLFFFVYGTEVIDDGQVAHQCIFLSPYPSNGILLYKRNEAWCLPYRRKPIPGSFTHYTPGMIVNIRGTLPRDGLTAEERLLRENQDRIRDHAMNRVKMRPDPLWPAPPYFVAWNPTQEMFVFDATVRLTFQNFSELLLVRMYIDEPNFAFEDNKRFSDWKEEISRIAAQMDDLLGLMLPIHTIITGNQVLGVLHILSFASDNLYEVKLYLLGKDITERDLMCNPTLYCSCERKAVWRDYSMTETEKPFETQEIAVIEQVTFVPL